MPITIQPHMIQKRMGQYFKPPWADDPGQYPADVLERHSAMCRACEVPDSTHPLTLRETLLQRDDFTEISRKADAAVERLAGMVAWGPTHDQPDEPLLSALRNPYYEHCCLFGGRGGGKSHETADAIVELASTEKHRVVCAREFQVSIADSSKQLLEDKIAASRWANEWTATEYALKNVVTGSVITFIGVARNPNSAKSMEGATIFWGEEAAHFSQASIDIILPTIRKGGSRFFWTYNPEQKNTPVDKMFRSGDPPERSYVRLVQCTDNPYFYSDTRMPSERRTAYAKLSLAKFRHIWFGGYDTNPDTLIYQNVRTGRVDLPPAATPRYGLDWGWVDPLAVLEFFVLEPDDPETERGIIYITGEVYGPKIPPQKIPGEIDSVMPLARSHTITADSAEPKSINDLRKAGFHVRPATKGPGSIRAGIAVIQGYDIVVSPDCPQTLAEFTAYQWKQLKDKTITRDPVDADNHAMDALRYGMEDYDAGVAAGGGVDYIRLNR